MQQDETAQQPPPPSGRLAGSTPPSSPSGPETRSRKRARTDPASSPSASNSADSNGSLGTAVGAQRTTSRDTADRYRGSTASAYNAWLQGIDTKTGGKPAYAPYIGPRSPSNSTLVGVLVSCAASQPTRTESR
jgi:hypothetical protein